MMQIDHLVVGCNDLLDGSVWLESQLGVAASGGGEHLGFGTHNRLWRLDGGRYLELIALQPGAVIDHTPMFGLGQGEIQAQLSDRPRLLSWVACMPMGSGDDHAGILARVPGLNPPMSVSRDQFRWRLAVARDGGLIDSGTVPYLIWWQPPHPTDVLPDVDLSLVRLELQTPSDAQVKSLAAAMPDEPITLQTGPFSIRAVLKGPKGQVVLD